MCHSQFSLEVATSQGFVFSDDSLDRVLAKDLRREATPIMSETDKARSSGTTVLRQC